MAYRLHKEETPQLIIEIVKSDQQTPLTREIEKSSLLSRAQHTLQVCAMGTATPARLDRKITQYGKQGGITTHTHRSRETVGNRKEGTFDFICQLVNYQGAQAKLPEEQHFLTTELILLTQ